MVLSIVSIFVYIEPLTKGFVGLSLFVVVMYAGAFPKRSTISKRLRAVRKEYSILGFVALVPHALVYLYEFLTGAFPVEWFGILAFVVMIPLFITSFTYIRRKMDNKTWVKLQRWAYLVYLATFVHLYLIGAEEHQIIYVVLFGVYTLLKLYNYVLKTNTQKIVVGVIAGLAFLIFMKNALGIEAGNGTVADIGNTFSITEEDYPDGTYTGYSTGFNNLPVEVDVVIQDGVVVDIIIVEDGSTGPRNGMDFEQAAIDVAQDIIDAQSTDVDTYSGATYSTSGIIAAVEDALK